MTRFAAQTTGQSAKHHIDDHDLVTESRLSKAFKCGTRALGVVVSEARRGGGGPPFTEYTASNGHLCRNYKWVDVRRWLEAEGLTFGPQPALAKERQQQKQTERTQSAASRTIASLRAQVKKLAEELDKAQKVIRVIKWAPRGLLPQEAIVMQAREVEKMCGVYFLVNNDEIVYIGKSVNIMSRVGGHLAGGTQFTHHYYVLCDEKNLDDLEQAYIKAFKPAENGVYKYAAYSGRCPSTIRTSLP